jgi:hypothetical protein
MSWTDLHIIGDLLLGRMLWLILMKAFFEPLAFWAGRKGWHFLDWLLDDRLPDLKP